MRSPTGGRAVPLGSTARKRGAPSRGALLTVSRESLKYSMPTQSTDSQLRPRDAFGRAGYTLVVLSVPLLACNALRAGGFLALGDIPLALGALLLFVAWLRAGHPEGAVPVGFAVGAFVLVGTGVLALLPAGRAESLASTVRFSLALCTPVVIMLAGTTTRRVHRVVDAWLIGAALSAAVGALDILGVTRFGASLTSVDFVAFADRASGLTQHPNHLGLVSAMALPVAIAQFSAAGRSRGLVGLVIVPLLLIGVVESGSRGALLAAAAGVALVFAIGSSATLRRRTALLVLAPVVAFVALVSTVGGSGLTGAVTAERFSGGGAALESNQERLLTLRESVDQVVENPLVGSGFSVVRTAHNVYLQVFQAGGVLALAAFVGLAGAVVLRARRLALVAQGELRPWLPSLAAATGASVCVWLLFGVVGNAIYDRYLYIPIGIVLALSSLYRQSVTRPPSVVPCRTGREPTVKASDSLGDRPLMVQ